VKQLQLGASLGLVFGVKFKLHHSPPGPFLAHLPVLLLYSEPAIIPDNLTEPAKALVFANPERTI
jgi:hypothetical protein